MTGGEKSSREQVVIGLDLGDRRSQYCVMVDGEVEEEGQLQTTKTALARWLAGRGEGLLVMEGGTHSPWVKRVGEEAGLRVAVLNAYRVKLISQSERKSDRNDAERLAYLGGLGAERLTTVYHRSEEAQADLAVVRNRQGLVQARTLLINQVRGTVKAVGARLPECDGRSFHRVAAAHVPAILGAALYPVLEAIAVLTKQIHEMDRRVEQLGRERYPETGLLRQVKGVGPLTALTYVLTLEDPGRFRRSDDVGAYLGLVPRRRQSGKRDPELGITKAGDRDLRYLLVEAAHYLVGPFGEDSDLRRWALARLEHAGASAKKRTVIAVARKLAVLLHRLWVTGAVYEPLRKEVRAAA